RHELRELRVSQVDQRCVIAALEIDVRRSLDAVVDHDLESIAFAEIRNRAALAIREHTLDLVFACPIDIPADLRSGTREAELPGLSAPEAPTAIRMPGLRRSTRGRRASGA